MNPVVIAADDFGRAAEFNEAVEMRVAVDFERSEPELAIAPEALAEVRRTRIQPIGHCGLGRVDLENDRQESARPP